MTARLLAIAVGLGVRFPDDDEDFPPPAWRGMSWAERREYILRRWDERAKAHQIADELGYESSRPVFKHLQTARREGDKRAHHRPQFVNSPRRRLPRA